MKTEGERGRTKRWDRQKTNNEKEEGEWRIKSDRLTRQTVKYLGVVMSDA